MSLNTITGPRAKGNEKEEAEPSKKVYKSYHLKGTTISLIKKVHLTIKIREDKYTQDDAIREGLELLAKEKGIEI